MVKFMQEAYTDEEQLGYSTIFHRHKACFESGEIAVWLPHIGQLLSISTERMVNTVTAVVREDSHIIIQQLAQALDISKSSVHTILREKLKMRKVAAC